jgi:hypothetical protein
MAAHGRIPRERQCLRNFGTGPAYAPGAGSIPVFLGFRLHRDRHRATGRVRLPNYTKMPVELITASLLIQPNRVFIIPEQRDLHVCDGEFRLEPISKPRGWPDVNAARIIGMRSAHSGSVPPPCGVSLKRMPFTVITIQPCVHGSARLTCIFRRRNTVACGFSLYLGHSS